MRILVYRPAGGLGDVVCCLPAVAGLRAKYPHDHLSVLAPDVYRPLYERLGVVDDFPTVRVMGRTRIGAGEEEVRILLRRMRPRPTLNWNKFVNLWCPAGEYENAVRGRVHKGRTECFCEAAGVEPATPRYRVEPQKRQWARGELLKWGLGRPLVVLQRHSANVYKDWPAAHRQALVDRLRADGCSVLTLGRNGPSIDGAVNVSTINFWSIAAFCGEADLVIAPDSGIMHLAGAVGAPVLALFGPTDPRTTLRYYPTARALWRPDVMRDTHCYCPCMHMPDNGYTANTPCLEEGACMRAITVDEVHRAATEMLAERASLTQVTEAVA